MGSVDHACMDVGRWVTSPTSRLTSLLQSAAPLWHILLVGPKQINISHLIDNIIFILFSVRGLNK